MSTVAPGGEIRDFPKVASITPMPPRQRYYGEDRRAPEPKPVTRIQSAIQTLTTVGAIVTVAFLFNMSGKVDERRLTTLEATDAKVAQAVEELTKANRLKEEEKKSETEDRILILEQMIRMEKDRERREELREALKRAKAKRLMSRAPKLDYADSSVIGGLPQ